MIHGSDVEVAAWIGRGRGGGGNADPNVVAHTQHAQVALIHQEN